ncbi:MAG: hypothetical protein NZ891_04325 [bacterium]|nr:hypothetical protein [bacterium]MDW8163949.1 hypothetical protein [Candidatus Omnitrophota bacterium]
MKNYKNLKFFCGKIGGITYYKYLLQYFFPEHEIKILKENINCSIYKIAKDSQCFEIGFYKDVENISPSASFSSILGKYIREIIMASIRKSLKIEEPISGYRDLKTKNSIKKIDFTRFKKNCVIRIS